MSLEGRTVAILAEDSYQELELWYPLLRLREAGARVLVVGSERGRTYASKYGYPVTADLSAEEADAARLDAIVIPGGYAPDRMRRHPAMVDLVREVHARGGVVAAICHAGWMLCSADIVRGRQVTCFPSIRDDLVNAGAHYVDQEVVRDGTIITSRQPEDLPAFCREIIAALEAE